MMLAHIHSTKEKLYGLFNLHVQLNITIGVKKGIFFSKECVHNYGKKKSDKYKRMDSDQWIYESAEVKYNLKSIDSHLCKQKTSQDRLTVIEQELVNNPEKNRFYIGEKQSSRKFRFRFWK